MDDTVLVWGLVGLALALLGWPMLRTLLSGVPMVTPGDVQGALDRGERPLLLDVRTPGEFRGGGHIRGSVNVPVDEVAGRAGALKPMVAERGGARVVVVCQSGMRAVRAAQALKRAGFADVCVLSGGIAAWAGAGLPVERRA